MSVNDTNYCDLAENRIKELGRPDERNPGRLRFNLTTSKIRNLLAMVNQIYNDVVLSDGDGLDERHKSRITYLRVRMLYEAGREDSVRSFLEKSKLLDELREIGGERKKFLLFCRYFEALVAYHKFYGGKD